MRKGHKQSGFAIGLLLLAVVLIAAIVAAIAVSTGESGTNARKEEAQIKAAAVIHQANTLRVGVDRYVVMGNNPINLVNNIDTLVDDGYVGTLSLPEGVTTDGSQWQVGYIGFDDGITETIYYSFILTNVDPQIALAINRIVADSFDSNDYLVDGYLHASLLDENPPSQGLSYYANYIADELLVGTAHAADQPPSCQPIGDFSHNNVCANILLGQDATQPFLQSGGIFSYLVNNNGETTGVFVMSLPVSPFTQPRIPVSQG